MAALIPETRLKSAEIKCTAASCPASLYAVVIRSRADGGNDRPTMISLQPAEARRRAIARPIPSVVVSSVTARVRTRAAHHCRHLATQLEPPISLACAGCHVVVVAMRLSLGVPAPQLYSVYPPPAIQPLRSICNARTWVPRAEVAAESMHCTWCRGCGAVASLFAGGRRAGGRRCGYSIWRSQGSRRQPGSAPRAGHQSCLVGTVVLVVTNAVDSTVPGRIPRWIPSLSCRYLLHVVPLEDIRRLLPNSVDSVGRWNGSPGWVTPSGMLGKSWV